MATHVRARTFGEQTENALGHAKVFQPIAKRAPLGSIGNNFSQASKKPKTGAVAGTRKALSSISNGVNNITRRSNKAKLAGVSSKGKTALVVHQDEPCEEAAPMDTAEELTMNLADALPAGVENIDAEDAENPQMVSEYVDDIYGYMRELEVRFAVDPSYLERQTEINERMRTILVDWLVEVHHRFDLLQETLYLTISLLDRYLERSNVARRQLQLVGVTAMLLASKYEEMYPPELGDFVYISDNTYTREQILQMEQHFCRTIDFSFGKPLPLQFLRRNSKAGKADATVHAIGKYLMELTLCSSNMLNYLPSQIAASATVIARDVVNEPDTWTATLQHFSGHTQDSLTPCVEAMKSILKGSRESKQQAVRSKFAKSKYMKISEDRELLAYMSTL